MAIWFVLPAVLACAAADTLQIDVSPLEIIAGRTVNVTITPSAPISGTVVFWPFVRGLQWGAQFTCAAPCHSASLIFPLPETGWSAVQVAVLAQPFSGPFTVGQELPATVQTLSNTVLVRVDARPKSARADPHTTAEASEAAHKHSHHHHGREHRDSMIRAKYVPERRTWIDKHGEEHESLPDTVSRAGAEATLVGMEWEPWFTVHNDVWNLHEAVPLVGLYDSFNALVLRQHMYWMLDAGVDFLVIDWTNNLWGMQHWSQRGVYAQELINATTFTLVEYQRLRDEEGLDPPKIVLLPGLDNGPTEPLACLGEEIDWVASNYLTNFSSDMWVVYEGKPLIVLFDGGGIYDGSPLNKAFTFRWMASQLQSNDLSKRGYWSWMDGSLSPVPTLHDGTTEAITVTPAFFADGGWLAPAAYPRLNGYTWVAEMVAAAATKPHFLIVCQWNEFAGQPDGSPAYADSYNVSLSNDIEPTSLTECGHVRKGDRSCGGWGFTYLNLLRATVDLLRNPDDNSTVIVFQQPQPLDEIAFGVLRVSWLVMGRAPAAVDIYLNNIKIGSSTTSWAMVDVSQTNVTGNCTLTLVAVGASTRYAISSTQEDQPGPYFAPRVSVGITIRAGASTHATVMSRAKGFWSIPQHTLYEYGPTIVNEKGTWHAFYCSPADGKTWDWIRHTTSTDGVTWTTPTIALQPAGPGTYSFESVCDPSLVLFRGTYYLYHTCINTVSAPDKFATNRICVAVADNITGPFVIIPGAVVEDLSCPTADYCVGQPSAVVVGSLVYLYYSNIRAGDTGVNPGLVFLAVSGDGLHFSSANPGTAPIYAERNVDVKYDRDNELFVFVQGDVGASYLTWSLSADGINWLPYNTSREIATNPQLPTGGTNNNPGLAGNPDGSFGGGSTFASYGSSYQVGWGYWWLYRTDLVIGPANTTGCLECAPQGCDFACSNTLHTTAHGTCGNPGSTDPGNCCDCSPAPRQPDCWRCAPTGCNKACQGAGGRRGGFCGQPGSTDPSDCCSCF